MKAMILAAGLGSRLGHLTEILPKPLLPIGGEPLLGILIKRLYMQGFTDIILNLYYCSDDIIRYLNLLQMDMTGQLPFVGTEPDGSNAPKGLHIEHIVEEGGLSGTAGGLKKCESFFKDEEDFLVVPGDAFTLVDFHELMMHHILIKSTATICTKAISVSNAHKFGVMKLSPMSDNVLEFIEKPEHIDSAEGPTVYCNTGIYAFNKKIFELIPKFTFYDFAKDVFPDKLKQHKPLRSYVTSRYWNDIGSIESYAQAQVDAHVSLSL